MLFSIVLPRSQPTQHTTADSAVRINVQTVSAYPLSAIAVLNSSTVVCSLRHPSSTARRTRNSPHPATYVNRNKQQVNNLFTANIPIAYINFQPKCPESMVDQSPPLGADPQRTIYKGPFCSCLDPLLYGRHSFLPPHCLGHTPKNTNITGSWIMTDSP